MPKKSARFSTIVVIPDSQVSPEHPGDFLAWVGRYIVDQFGSRPNVKIVHLGDLYDMPSLSSYDKKGGKMAEGRRYTADVEAGNRAFALLNNPIQRHLEKHPDWGVERHFLFGNHENRIVRAYEQGDAVLEGALALDHLLTPGWERHPFLEVLVLDGTAFSHYFVNPGTGRPFAGNIETRIKAVGRSFVQGHQQALMFGVVPIAGTRRYGIVAGACYSHDEDFLGPQGNDYWRGIIVLNEAREGLFDPMFVSLDYLKERYYR